MAGQSNASGRSVSPLLPAPSDAEVKLYANRDNSTGLKTWGELTSQPSGSHSIGFGPEIGIGRHLYEAGVPNVHIVKVSEGGTYVAAENDVKSWNSREGGDLYERWLNEVDHAIDLLLVEHPDTPISINGVFWMQGESDANKNHPTRQEDYLDNMLALAFDFERDLRELVVGRLPEEINPFVMVQSDLPFFMGILNSEIYTNTAEPMTQASLESIRKSQRDLCKLDPQFTCVSTEGLQLKSDRIHFADQGLLDLGKRFGMAYVDIPEPATYVLMCFGLGGLMASRLGSVKRTV